MKEALSINFFLFIQSPVPELRWSKYREPMPTTAEISASGAVLKIFNIQFEDEGTYECEAENHKGKDKHSANVYVQGRIFFHTLHHSRFYDEHFTIHTCCILYKYLKKLCFS